MKTIVKIYQTNLISNILNASCFSELKCNIEEIISKIRSQKLPENQLSELLTETLQELRLLNEGRLPYDQHANIISAKNILKQLRMQETRSDNEE